MKSWIATIALFGMGALCAPAFGSTQPGPGTLNYLEGSASLSGKQLQHKNIGNSTMQPGQVLNTHNGRAEVLLTPGSYMRVAKHSSVKMVSSGIMSTKVNLVKGEAGFEVDQIGSNNTIAVVDNGVTTHLVKRGFYEFFAKKPRVMVFSGEAQVETQAGNFHGVGRNHLMMLQPGNEQTQGFSATEARDQLYRWSKARHQYLAENQNQGRYEGNGPGWAWNPYVGGYTFWGGLGPYWGGPYYSPWWGGFWGGGLYGPYFGGPGFYGPGFYGPGFYVTPGHHEPDRDDFGGGHARFEHHGDFGHGAVRGGEASHGGHGR